MEKEGHLGGQKHGLGSSFQEAYQGLVGQHPPAPRQGSLAAFSQGAPPTAMD